MLQAQAVRSVARSRQRLRIVKWFDPNKGYGLIKLESGNDVFVHAGAIHDGGSLAEG
jgi:cold shock protein